MIINKVHVEKIPEIARFLRSGLKRKGLELLGILPHEQLLSRPTVDLIREELHAELLNTPAAMNIVVDDIVLRRDGRAECDAIFQARHPANHAG